MAPVLIKLPSSVIINECVSPSATYLTLIPPNSTFSGKNALSVQSSPNPSYPCNANPNVYKSWDYYKIYAECLEPAEICYIF